MKTGYFFDEKREYVIENMYPIRPLKNYVWNDITFAELNQFCFGTSKCCIDKEFKPLVNDVRLIYVKDNESGDIYDVNRNFKKLAFDVFRCKVGLGYQTTESSYKGLESSFTVLIPERGYLEMQKLTLKNVGNTVRKYSVYSYIRPFVNINGHLAYGKGYYDKNINALYYTFRAFRCEQKYTDVFYKASETPIAYSTSDSGFLGYGTWERPAGLENERLKNDDAVFENDYCGAMQFEITLAPNEEKSLYFAVGTTQGEEESATLAEYATQARFECEYARQRAMVEEYVDKVRIKTPDEYLNSMVNVWLKRQITLGKTWGRIYGKGFRDLLQDITGFVSFDCERAKERLLYTLEHQFISGNGLRQFDPIVDYPYQDMPVWIPIAVLTYVKESGDYAVLDTRIGYYDADVKESVFFHIQRGMDYLYANQGEHGLNLWFGGDWNDSMNNCGLQGKGESVWLAIATVKATLDYLELLKNCPNIVGATEIIKEITPKMQLLKENIRKYGFEKDHFIYGINDWGEKVGSYENEEGQMYLNPQTWAIMAGILNETESNALMEHVEKNLKCDYGYLQNVPSYTKPDLHLGRISYFGAGLYENGSVYNHGVMFKLVADCMLGKGDSAYDTLRLIAYDNPANADSGVEPYAVSNMYFGPSAFARKGFAPCSWVTGSAGWLYRALTEYILGVQADFDGLKLCPCIPSEWENAKIERTFRGVKYLIEIRRGNKSGTFVDGVKIEGNKIPLFDKGTTHKVEYWC